MVKRKKLKGRRKKQRGGDRMPMSNTPSANEKSPAPSAPPQPKMNPVTQRSESNNKGKISSKNLGFREERRHGTRMPGSSSSSAESQRMSKKKKGSSRIDLLNVGGKIQQIGVNESDFVGKILFFIGIITFIVGIFSNSMHTMLIAYGCMMAGVAMSFMMILIWSSNNSKSENILQLFNKITPLILPTLCLLGTLVVLVFIFTKAKNAFKSDGCDIPGIFNKFNYLTFMFLTIQIYLLNKFYGQYKKTIRSGKDLGNMKWVYVSGFILSSILTLAFSSELYTIVISFLTDG